MKTTINDITQYIIVRKDLNMSVGKLAAQVSHAAVNAYVKASKGSVEEFLAAEIWINGNFKKVVLGINSEKALLALAEKLEQDNIKYELIYDNGLTELQSGTLTCMGIIPYPKFRLKDKLKRLQVL